MYVAKKFHELSFRWWSCCQECSKTVIQHHCWRHWAHASGEYVLHEDRNDMLRVSEIIGCGWTHFTMWWEECCFTSQLFWECNHHESKWGSVSRLEPWSSNTLHCICLDHGEWKQEVCACVCGLLSFHVCVNQKMFQLGKYVTHFCYLPLLMDFLGRNCPRFAVHTLAAHTWAEAKECETIWPYTPPCVCLLLSWKYLPSACCVKGAYNTPNWFSHVIHQERITC